MKFCRTPALPLALALLTALPAVVRAADHTNLEEGIPTQLADAYPIGYLGKELQLATRFDRTADHRNLFLVEPRFEYGLARDLQVSVGVPFNYGSAAPRQAGGRGIGNVNLSALYNFNQESLVLPALALSARAEFPTADRARGVDTAVGVVFSKTLGAANFIPRLHVNALWLHNAGAGSRERENGYRLIGGYTMRVGADTFVILDHVHERAVNERRTSEVVELGLRRQVTPRLVLSIGGGAGLTDDSPHARASLGAQFTF